MAAVIVEKKKVEKLGKKVLKELFDFFDSDFTKEHLPESKAKKEEILRSLIYKEFYDRHNTVKQSGSKLEFSYEKYDESKFEEDIKRITSEIKNESINIDYIFPCLNIDFGDLTEDEDVFDNLKAFLSIYKVFKYYSCYLED